jgi:DNA-binding CsgD family transcriptional regulator
MAVLAVLRYIRHEQGEQDSAATLKSSKGTRTLQRRRRTEPAKIRRLKAQQRIRRLVGEGKTNKEIIDELGLSERSYYRYMRAAYERDLQALEEQDAATCSLQVSTLKARLTGIIRRCTEIAEDQNVPLPERLAAEQMLCQVSITLVKASFEGVWIVRDLIASSPASPLELKSH